MLKVTRSEILSIAEYELIRPHFRARVIAEKVPRRVIVGDYISVLFENHDSVLLQIQEMLRTERITSEPAIQHEIDTYNDLIAGPDQLSFTLFVELPDQQERERMLVELAGLETAVAIEVDGVRCPAQQRLPEAHMPTRTTAVHYFKVQLPPAAAEALRQRRASAALRVDHPRLTLHRPLSPETLAALAADLRS